MALILSGSDGVSDVDGSAATPAVRGSDTNTGIFFPGADRIGFAEGGSQVGEFDANGNFLVGTTTNTNNSRIVANGVIESTSGGVRFPDGSTQTTAAGAVTTDAVLNATAGASAGAIGSYAFMYSGGGPNLGPGGTVAGSSLRYSAINAFPFANLSSTASGTWRVMGALGLGGSTGDQTVCLRIS